MNSHCPCSSAHCANLQYTANLDVLRGQSICTFPIRYTLNRVITSPFTCGNILYAETEEMKSDHERMGVARGVKGEKARQCCAEAMCLLWGGVELTEATSRDSSLSIKELRRRGRVCQGFPIPTEHPHAAPPTLNTFSQSRKAPHAATSLQTHWQCMTNPQLNHPNITRV